MDEHILTEVKEKFNFNFTNKKFEDCNPVINCRSSLFLLSRNAHLGYFCTNISTCPRFEGAAVHRCPAINSLSWKVTNSKQTRETKYQTSAYLAEVTTFTFQGGFRWYGISFVTLTITIGHAIKHYFMQKKKRKEKQGWRSSRRRRKQHSITPDFFLKEAQPLVSRIVRYLALKDTSANRPSRSGRLINTFLLRSGKVVWK